MQIFPVRLDGLEVRPTISCVNDMTGEVFNMPAPPGFRGLHSQNERHVTSCFVVMPNHVHAVIQPIHGYELEDCLQRIKQFVSLRVNAALGQTGPLWAEESYDRIVRNEEHLWNVVQYIGRNPRTAGISADRWVRWIHPQWEAAGWRFVDP